MGFCRYAIAPAGCRCGLDRQSGTLVQTNPADGLSQVMLRPRKPKQAKSSYGRHRIRGARSFRRLVTKRPPERRNAICARCAFPDHAGAGICPFVRNRPKSKSKFTLPGPWVGLSA